MNEIIDNKKTWFVVILWRPNTGKSTFINTLIWEKVSIVSSTPQTTRKKIIWVYNDDDSQIIFIDTPGIHKWERQVNTHINTQALWSIQDADVVLYFIDPTRPLWEEEKMLEDVFLKCTQAKVKVYTKSDIQQKHEEGALSISSISREGFTELLAAIKALLPQGPLYYPQDVYTYQTDEQRIEEIVREKIFLHTKEEIPHSTFVEVEDIQEEGKMLKIHAYIYVETESQKIIVIWKKAELLSQIGKEARLELEDIFWKKIFLSLRVKVALKWRDDKKVLERVFRA